nr:tetratricopeptide repeat protein [Candidatus Njordarchaeum guaymaensis]
MSAELWFRRGVEHGIRGDIDEEIKCYMKALELDPKYAKAWKNLGSAFMVKGDVKKGLKTLRIAVRLDPNDLNTWMDMGRLKYNAKDFRGAIDAFKKGIEINPKLGKSWHWYGLSLHELGFEKEASEALSMAVRLYKDSGDIESAAEVESKLITIEGSQ